MPIFLLFSRSPHHSGDVVVIYSLIYCLFLTWIIHSCEKYTNTFVVLPFMAIEWFMRWPIIGFAIWKWHQHQFQFQSECAHMGHTLSSFLAHSIINFLFVCLFSDDGVVVHGLHYYDIWFYFIYLRVVAVFLSDSDLKS